MDLNTLQKELDRFDWSYQYSDDFSYWASGESHIKKIKEMIGNILSENPSLEKKIIDMINKTQAKEFKSPVIDAKNMVVNSKREYGKKPAFTKSVAIKEANTDIKGKIKKDVILDKGDVIKKDGVPVKLKQSATAMTTMKNEKHLRLKELLKKKIKRLKEKKDISGISQLKEKLGLKEAVGAYSFDNVKRDKEGFYNKIEIMGHEWAKERLDAIEQLCNKYGQTQFQKYIIANAFDFTRPGDDWHYFLRISKKYLSQVQYILKNSSSQTPFQLLMWLENHSGMLKTELNWALEWAAYKKNREEYKRSYIQGFGYMGMRPEEAEKRMKNYISKIVAKDVVHPEWISENITKTSKVLVETSYASEMLMQADYKIWDKLGASDGGDIQRKWKQYVELVKKLMGNRKINRKMYDELEDDNHHSLLKALEELGLVEK